MLTLPLFFMFSDAGCWLFNRCFFDKFGSISPLVVLEIHVKFDRRSQLDFFPPLFSSECSKWDRPPATIAWYKIWTTLHDVKLQGVPRLMDNLKLPMENTVQRSPLNTEKFIRAFSIQNIRGLNGEFLSIKFGTPCRMQVHRSLTVAFNKNGNEFWMGWNHRHWFRVFFKGPVVLHSYSCQVKRPLQKWQLILQFKCQLGHLFLRRRLKGLKKSSYINLCYKKVL